jgi:hypothetical protein
VKTVIGGETEYAISARDVHGRVVPQAQLLTGLIEHAEATLGHSSLSNRSRFLSNGGLLYLDAGLHLEWSTPETTSPVDVVRYLKAGDEIVRSLCASYGRRRLSGARVFSSRASVDYVASTSWAAHESYMHRAAPSSLAAELIPFLASRVVFGAGGWDYRSPALRFMLSPRAAFITHEVDCDTQYIRPLFHTKDEPLTGTGSHRLHVACSESLCSDTGNVLRFGTTALVLAVIEQGGRPGRDAALVNPVHAVQHFASDDRLTARAALANGRRATALDLQRHYLASVERALGSRRLPDWAEWLCALWRRTLDSLAGGPAGAGATLDWAIKRRLFTRRLERHGLDWSSLRVFDVALRRLAALEGAPPVCVADLPLDPGPASRARMDALAPVLARRGASWDQLPALAAARAELFELDAKFGALEADGVFNALDRAGALEHRVPGTEVGDALDRAPQDTRARIRGDVVRRLSQARTPYHAHWTGIYDRHRGLELDLRDPFETEERWRRCQPTGEPPPPAAP